MVDKHEQDANTEIDLEIDTNSTDEPDLVSVEATSSDTIKTLRTKLKACEAEKRTHLEELQRAKADFLNAKKRLDNERRLDRARATKAHVEELLPLCDSFTMAMSDQAAWAEAPEKWRRGVEGIHAQLMSLLAQYNVQPVDPTGESFDPKLHEAVGNEPVTDPAKVDTVLRVVQYGYTMTTDGEVHHIRPARVIVGSDT